MDGTILIEQKKVRYINNVPLNLFMSSLLLQPDCLTKNSTADDDKEVCSLHFLSVESEVTAVFQLDYILYDLR